MDKDLRLGAENLLHRCARLRAGNRLLILHEAPCHGYYDQAVADAVADTARSLGIEVRILPVPFLSVIDALPDDVQGAMGQAECSLFLARMGDQIRFNPDLARGHPIMCYALDAAMLRSGFGRANHDGMLAIKEAVNAALANATEIRVTCPLGTDFIGPGAHFPSGDSADVAIRRFPMSVFSPVPCAGFSGHVVQRGFLVGTGSRYYDGYGRKLDAPVTVRFEGTRITGFEGPGAEDAQRHYDTVGARFGIDPRFLHSWHVGIHPGCDYPSPAAANYERWSGTAFGNPRLLHLHSCGAYAPGEISLNVLDPTVLVDDVAVWELGRLWPQRIAGGAEILAQHPDLAAMFAAPARHVGQGADGQLSGDA